MGVGVSFLLSRGGIQASWSLHFHGEGQGAHYHLTRMKVFLFYLASSHTPMGVLGCLLYENKYGNLN